MDFRRTSERMEQWGVRLAERGWLLLLVFSALYFPFAFVTASSKHLWYDEIWTRYMCRLSFAELLRALHLGLNMQPPLFYTVTRACVALVGENPVGLRLPGMIG